MLPDFPVLLALALALLATLPTPGGAAGAWDDVHAPEELNDLGRGCPRRCGSPRASGARAHLRSSGGLRVGTREPGGLGEQPRHRPRSSTPPGACGWHARQGREPGCRPTVRPGPRSTPRRPCRRTRSTRCAARAIGLDRHAGGLALWTARRSRGRCPTRHGLARFRQQRGAWRRGPERLGVRARRDGRLRGVASNLTAVGPRSLGALQSPFSAATERPRSVVLASGAVLPAGTGPPSGWSSVDPRRRAAAARPTSAGHLQFGERGCGGWTGSHWTLLPGSPIATIRSPGEVDSRREPCRARRSRPGPGLLHVEGSSWTSPDAAAPCTTSRTSPWTARGCG